MYQQRYTEMASDSAQVSRAREKAALEHANAMLSVAKAHGLLTPEAFEATNFTRSLWSIFINDLNSDENGLPQELRASLISIGLWVRREVDLIDQGKSRNFDGLMEINQLIADGLV
jgi:flagellar biosynthesis activator protein FlaF